MISFAAHLKRQSPSMSYGNGWIMGENGKRWHPCADQKLLLRDLTTKRTGLINRLRKIFGG
ncbi:phage filamentation protein Fil family protein [Pantoea sp. UBA6567]|uniref:phage filamentation protein Fil family protein n=1 Tax=Pantoea sp. UBA6567 TaxID=1947043 RepID=UPI002593DED4|nr:phage filamentation protein Fil family protein [Pantoea sp. UBA6567]